MAFVTVRPTSLDIAIADEVADHATPGTEKAAEALTWSADEHVLVALAAASWFYVQFRRPAARLLADHVLAVSVMTAVLPHLLKSLFDQTRPDRLTVRGHYRGVPISGRRNDAFPSGHALHMGALASAAGLLPARRRRTARALAVGLSLTRIALLAHWSTDVLAGFALGIGVERLLRPWTMARRTRR